MKIVFGNNRSEIAEHAQRLLRKQRMLQDKHADHNPVPMGVALYAASFPQTCDDCGDTYWVRDQYSPHRGCRMGRSSTVGFNPREF